MRLPLLTSEAVLTELFHFVGDSRLEMETAWKFVRSGAVILGMIENAELAHVHALMSRFPLQFSLEFFAQTPAIDRSFHALHCSA